MNYRKIANGKSAILNMAKVAKEAVVDASKKAQGYLADGTEEAKSAVADIKNSVTSAVKSKLADEFRKNYPAYVIDEIDKIVVNAMSANVHDIEITLFDNDDPAQYSVQELVKTVAEGMVDETVLAKYVSGQMLTGLFDYIVAYYEAQEQVKVMNLRNTLYINIPYVSVEGEDDVEVDSEDETPEETPSEEE